MLALTFDDGPHAVGLNAVLDVLKSQRVPVTFFVNTYLMNDDLEGVFTHAANQVSGTHCQLLQAALTERHAASMSAAWWGNCMVQVLCTTSEQLLLVCYP